MQKIPETNLMIGATGTGPRPAPEGENKKTPETNLMISGMRGGRRRGARETGGRRSICGAADHIHSEKQRVARQTKSVRFCMLYAYDCQAPTAAASVTFRAKKPAIAEHTKLTEIILAWRHRSSLSKTKY